jgi:uncharacterized RDD family membrane protein YckC
MRFTPILKQVVAFIIDFLSSFLVFGYIIAILTHNIVRGGFALKGAPAVILVLLVIAYFVGMNRWAGGTLAKHLLGVKPSATKNPT